jgi:hypothetical protein
MRRHEADLMLTDAAINEIARIALGLAREPKGFERWLRRSWKR